MTDCNEDCDNCEIFDSCWGEIQEFLTRLDESGTVVNAFAAAVVAEINNQRAPRMITGDEEEEMDEEERHELEREGYIMLKEDRWDR